MTKEILLTKGKVALVDDEDYEFLNRWKWKYTNGYAARNQYIGNYQATYLCMHRVVLNAPRGMEVDHINHYGLDNRKINLRICTHSQNMENMILHKKKIPKGISWHKHRKKWQATIWKDKKSFHLGVFKNIDDAVRARKEKAKEMFGEFFNE